MNMNISERRLDREAIDAQKLSSFIDVATGCDCPMDDSTPKSAIEDYYPLVNWLLGTPMSRVIRNRFDMEHVSQTENGWSLKIPGNFWTNIPEAQAQTECCWIPMDFDKCCSEVPMNLLCLKDCDSVFNNLVKRDLRVTSKNAMRGISNTGESVETVERRIARLSFAFYQAHTAILGMDNTYTNILKPFHGLMQVLENPAIQSMYAYDILGVFDELGCRLDVLGDLSGYVIAVNPLIYNSIDAVITRGQNGEYPRGWSRQNGRVYFKGIRFLEDKLVPVNLADGTGEAWLLDGQAVGLFMATNLMVGNDFIKESGIDTSENNCGAECTYYYNYGAAFANNAQRLAKIVGIPVNSACSSVLSDLKGLITPQTLIPNGAIA